MYLFFDTETTGLSRSSDRVVQLAWILADRHGNAVAEESHVIRPAGYSIPYESSRIHGITTAQALEIGKPLKWVLQRLSKNVAQASIAVAHNLSFDLGILRGDYERAGLAFPFERLAHICTMKQSTQWCRIPKKNFSTTYKWPKLEELHARLFGQSFDGAHDALVDTQACKRCYFELVKLGVIDKAEFTEKQVAHTTRTHAVDAEYEAEDEESSVPDASVSSKTLAPNEVASKLSALQRKLARRDQRIFDLENQVKILKERLAEKKDVAGQLAKTQNSDKREQVRPSPSTSKIETVKAKTKTLATAPATHQTKEFVALLPDWLTDSKRQLLEESGHRISVDKGNLIDTDRAGVRTRIFSSADLDNLIESIGRQNDCGSDAITPKSINKALNSAKNCEEIKSWVLDQKTQTIRNRTTYATFPLSSFNYVASPIPGYESITHRLWIRACDIEDGVNKPEEQPKNAEQAATTGIRWCNQVED